ncbi:MAG TPA: ornithine cyclodeaminase family protein [Blastocatellia bacterium]|nr:ornithine cyclodeaminase family protein [Blastocatellia bacterium]
MSILFLSQDEVRRLLNLDDLLDALAEGFMALTSGEVCAPPRNEVTVPAGFLLGMPASMPDHQIAVKLVSVFHDNQRYGIPGHQALLCLFDPETGSTCAIMDGTYITAMRTAGSAALSARLLARESSSTLAIIGAGAQGEAHLKLLPRACNFKKIRIASLHTADAERISILDPRAIAVESFEQAVRWADVVCLCTTSNRAVVKREWLARGTHLTSVGFKPPGGELSREIAEQGRLFVETRQAFQPAPVGCDELAGLDPERGTELGEVLLNLRPGRQSKDELTVYKSMGHAIEDLVVANLVYRRAQATGLGTILRL